MRGYQEVELRQSDAFFDAFGAGTVPVAVEVRPGSESLIDFEHPEQALYVFGAEDGSLVPRRAATLPPLRGHPDPALHEPGGGGLHRALRPAREAGAGRSGGAAPAGRVAGNGGVPGGRLDDGRGRRHLGSVTIGAPDASTSRGRSSAGTAGRSIAVPLVSRAATRPRGVLVNPAISDHGIRRRPSRAGHGQPVGVGVGPAPPRPDRHRERDHHANSR